jgi:integrase
MPNIEKSKRRSLTKLEKEYIVNANFDLKRKAFVYTLLYTGLRLGEILALTLKDIDINKKMIRIDKSLVFGGNKSILKPTPKSDAGNRLIPIPDILYNVLTEYLTDFTGTHVFPMNTGTPMTQTAFRRMWEGILRDIRNVFDTKDNNELELANDITPHLFRHTYATDLYYVGVDVKAAQYLLGHASVEMTLEIYTHLDRSNDALTAELINSYHSPTDKIQSKISQKLKNA